MRDPRTTVMQAALAVVLLCASASSRAEVSFEARLDPDRVEIGESALLEVTLSVTDESLVGIPTPTVEGATLSGGGSMTNTSFVNGAVTKSRTLSWWVTPRGEGDVTVPALTVTVDGRVYSTRPLTLKVGAAPAPAPRTGAVSGAGERFGPASGRPGDDAFVTIGVDRDSAVVGQQVVLAFRYYQRPGAGLSRPGYEAPRSEGFWREPLGQGQPRQVRRQGVVYEMIEVRYALFPTRPGDLTIASATVEVPPDPFADFFSSRRGRRGPLVLGTPPVTVVARDLPAVRPADFGGLVSRNVTVSLRASGGEVPLGEAVTVTLRVEADGMLKSFEPPGWELPEGFALHDAGQSTDQGPEGRRLRSTWTREWALQPLAEGGFELPPVEVAYFDPVRGEFTHARSDPLRLRVSPGELPALEAGDGAGPRRLARLADDLAYVKVDLKGAPFWHRPDGSVLGVAAGLPLLLLALVGWLRMRRDAEARDPVGARRRRAGATARRRLREAAAETDPRAAWSALRAALLGYAADRAGRPVADVDEALVRSLGAGDDFVSLLRTCDRALFGSAADAPARDPGSACEEARRCVETLEATNSRGRGPASGAALLICAALFAAADGVLAAELPVESLSRGNAAYAASDFEAAREAYEEAARLVDDPLTHYNLGTVCARQGDLGLAVLHLLRAERAAPRDPEVAANLAHVRAELADVDLRGETPGFVGAAAAGLVGFLSLGEWAWIDVTLLWVVAGVLAFAWWRRGFSIVTRRLLTVSALLLTVALAIGAFRWVDEARTVHAVVVAREVDIRSGPDESFPISFEVHEGLEVRLRTERDGWAQVSLGGEWSGWLPSAAVVAVAPEHEAER